VERRGVRRAHQHARAGRARRALPRDGTGHPAVGQSGGRFFILSELFFRTPFHHAVEREREKQSLCLCMLTLENTQPRAIVLYKSNLNFFVHNIFLILNLQGF
jgi:hypothetical protein